MNANAHHVPLLSPESPMSTRSILFAGLASLVLVAIGAVIQDASMVVGGLLSTLVASLLIAIKTEETSRPMAQILLEDPAAELLSCANGCGARAAGPARRRPRPAGASPP